MSKGVVLTVLVYSLKYKWCSLQNGVNLEDVEDIVITLTNNSSKVVDIQEHELLCRVCYKRNTILIKTKSKMKENLYPGLPRAPPIDDQGQGYRLQKINEIQAFLEKEVVTREALSSRYIMREPSPFRIYASKSIFVPENSNI